MRVVVNVQAKGSMNTTLRKILQVTLPLTVLAATSGLVAWLIQSAPEPKQASRTQQGAWVETQTVAQASRRLDVHAQGTVIAAREVAITPQVRGVIVERHPNLRPGGLIRENDVLVRIEDRDYDLIEDQRRAAVSEARAQLKLERGKQQIAKREWALFKNDPRAPDVDPGLALRKPQLRIARKTLARARRNGSWRSSMSSVPSFAHPLMRLFCKTTWTLDSW